MRSLLLVAVLCIPMIFVGQSYTNIESTEYDPQNNRFLVSNGNSIIARASDGTLSYFGNAEADYGMEIIGNTLFAINSTFNSNSIEGYDLTTGEEVMSVVIENTDFLNGMATDGVSKLWVTDFSGGTIIEVDVSDLNNPGYEVVVENTGTIPNGIVYDEANNRLVFVNWGNNAPIVEVNLPSYIMSTILNSGLTNLDGIDMDGQGNFFVSSWSPTRITKYTSDFSNSEIIDAPGLSSPADISYGVAIDTLAVPNSGNETLTMIGFGSTAIVPSDQNNHALTISPNPVSSTGTIAFYLAQAGEMSLKIFDTSGKLVYELSDSHRNAGAHQVLLQGLKFENGMYICTLEINNQLLKESFLVE